MIDTMMNTLMLQRNHYPDIPHKGMRRVGNKAAMNDSNTKLNNGNAENANEHKTMSFRAYIVMLAMILLANLVAQYGAAGNYFFKALQNLKTIKAKKRLPEQVVSKPITEPWPEPESPEVLFNNSTRIIWGYWDKGKDNLPGLCQLAVRSWRARHPHWHIVIISDENYKDYVSLSDLPSTFDSLIVQHRSDIIRLAVLLRYGGVYMDVSTVALKGFDYIWNSTSPDDLLLTTALTFSNGVSMTNNALILAPGHDNPVLRELQHRVLAYSEAPVATRDEMLAHPAFRRVAPLFDEPGLGVLQEIIPYCSFLWIFTDLLYYDQALRPFIKENVRVLPGRRWTFDVFSLPILGKTTTYDPTKDPPVTTWAKYALLRSMWSRSLDRFFDDKERAERLIEQINVLKFSSAGIDFHLPMKHYLELESTMGRIYRAAVSEGLTIQATLKGATPVTVVE